ncbi:hypothetical protein JXA40_12370 [bacterium]|nr:hypothetical protein [candidate division CSSED10-310 bacterium]
MDIRLDALRLICSIVFSLLLLLFVRRLFIVNSGMNRIGPGIRRTSGAVPVILFFLLIAYQARWQMFGFLDSGFLRVQRGFDPRGTLIGCRFHRGEILDAEGRLLAYDAHRDASLIRTYPLNASTLHLVGYHDAVFGSTSMEKELDACLMGRSLTGVGNILRLAGNAFVHRKMNGNPVRLTVYGRLQEKAYRLMDGRTGAVVAVDPRDGAVLTLVSSPGFNPNDLSREKFSALRNHPDHPFLNRVTQGVYPPGSTFKTLVAMKALELGLKPEYVCSEKGFDCGSGQPELHDYQYYAMKERGEVFEGHGRLNLDQALTKSCNVYFAHLGVALGSEHLIGVARTAGFDVQIPAAGPGLPTRAGSVPPDGDISLSRLIRLAIGQDELLVTPLHLALVTGALGSNGTMYRPRYVESEKTCPWRNLTDARTATEIARKMIQVVEFGTGQSARIPGVIVGGKTGTAENASGRSHAVFIGFAPWPGPVIAVAVVIEQGGLGGVVAAPVAAGLFKAAEEIGLFDAGMETGP